MIEGTQSSLADLMLYEIDEEPGVPVEDAREVSRYVDALKYGLRTIRGGTPLMLRLIREIHGVLLRDRGTRVTAGEFRRSQVWIGGTRPGNAVFVPPPPNALAEVLTRFEAFVNDASVPPLLRAALGHVQFETIHPFLDGNGRVGRLLIALQLAEAGLLRQPLLYVSLHFKEHRRTYYELLNGVRENGDWEAWLEFFAEAIESGATAAVTSARRLLDLSSVDAGRINGLGRAAESAHAVHAVLQKQPIATAASLAKATKLTPATVNKALVHLERLKIVTELTSRKRDRIFSYRKYNAVLNEGLAPIGGSR
jgi:Fic family protein